MAGVIASKVRKQRSALKADTSRDAETQNNYLNAVAVERWRQQANNRKKELAQTPPVAEEDDLSSSSWNILLYFGLGLMCVGSVIAFVGVGDKGYQTLELRLVGPILAVSGALLVCCRVIMCFIVII